MAVVLQGFSGTVTIVNDMYGNPTIKLVPYIHSRSHEPSPRSSPKYAQRLAPRVPIVVPPRTTPVVVPPRVISPLSLKPSSSTSTVTRRSPCSTPLCPSRTSSSCSRREKPVEVQPHLPDSEVHGFTDTDSCHDSSDAVEFENIDFRKGVWVPIPVDGDISPDTFVKTVATVVAGSADPGDEIEIERNVIGRIDGVANPGYTEILFPTLGVACKRRVIDDDLIDECVRFVRHGARESGGIAAVG